VNSTASTSYPNEDFVVTCVGKIYTGTNNLDRIKVLSSGGVFLWEDNVKGVKYNDKTATALK
jgi:hypothetical protein